MNKAEVSTLLKKINLAYPTFSIPDEPEDSRELLDGWHYFLSEIPFSLAETNLKNYALNPENKYPPHPGALCKKKTEMDLYFNHMRTAGMKTLEDYDQLREKAVAPTLDQLRRVRELLGTSI